MRAEIKARLNGPGYRFLSDTRVNRFINQARQEVDRSQLWGYLEKSVTGVSPLAITDLGTVEAVFNTTQSSYRLSKVDWQTLSDLYGDLSTSGSPSYYYIATPAGVPEVATYPSNSNVIGVQYWRVTADLSADSDEPAAPDDFHGLICDIATAIALRANRQHNEAAAYEQAIERERERMLATLTTGTPDGPDAYQAISYASEDW